MLSAVIAARGRKYLMMNAPAAGSPSSRRCSRPSNRRRSSRSRMPGMIAIHSVVGADDVWGLLPRLKARRRVRASSSCPIEKIVP